MDFIAFMRRQHFSESVREMSLEMTELKRVKNPLHSVGLPEKVGSCVFKVVALQELMLLSCWR